MFHRPVGGVSSSSHASADNVGAMSHSRGVFHQNENVLRNFPSKSSSAMSERTPGKTSTTTPAKSLNQSRRAFGDISNKKATRSSNNGGNNAPSKSSALPLKPRQSILPNSNDPNTPRQSSNGTRQFQSRIPKLGGTTTSTGTKARHVPLRSHPWSNTKNVKLSQPLPTVATPSANKHTAPTPTRPQSHFLVPNRTPTYDSSKPSTKHSFTQSSKIGASRQQRGSRISEGPVDDVELPAGRLWVQQLAIDDPNGDNDDASTSSLGEILEQRTMWEDWRESMRLQWEEERTRLNLEEDRKVQEQLELVLKQDQREEGLDSLLDWVEGWTLQSGSDALVSKELLLDDDNWSDPASSLDGALRLDLLDSSF